MADAHGSGPCARKGVGVQVPPRAPRPVDDDEPVTLWSPARAVPGATACSGTVGVMGTDDCVFCRVVAGSLESSRVYEDDEVLAFMDIQPVTDGHHLVIPKRHVAYLADLDDAAERVRVGLATQLA